MDVLDRIGGYHGELTRLRRDLHAHPELAFAEERTADIVARALQSFGLEVHRGLAKTGVVATIRAGTGNRAIALRADMDALEIDEQNDIPHRSLHKGRMHACGHDGHTAMLLGAARYLAEARDFDGAVHLIFQPAEEMGGGGRVMIEEGLFERFPCEAVYGLHNMPGIPVGTFAVRTGPLLASSDLFTIRIRGRGAHAAFPHQGIDPIVIAGEMIVALQSVVSRALNPIDAAVVTVTRMAAGQAKNAIPDEAELGGTVRTFLPEVRQRVEARIRAIAEGLPAVYGATGALTWEPAYPPTINAPSETALAAEAAARLVGAEKVVEAPLSMACDDIGYMLRARPGSHVLIGNGVGAGVGEGGCAVHNPRYDFNDAILPLGAAFWVSVVHTALPQRR